MPVLKAKHVVPVTAAPIADGAVAVISDSIAAVGEAADITGRFPDEPVEDFGNSAIIPGFVNCHAHLELTAFRGLADHLDDDFVGWLLEVTKLRKEHEPGDGMALSALLGACEAAAAGVTTIGDVARHGAAGMSALHKIGLRGIVYQETEFSPDDSTSEADFEALLRNYEMLAESSTDLVEAGISPHTPYTVSAGLFEKIARYSLDNKIALTIHAAESGAEIDLMLTGSGFFAEIFRKASLNWRVPGKRTIEYLSALGILDTSPLLVHCVHVSEDEIGLIAKTGSKIAHCPKSNAKFGHGIAPLGNFLRSGVKTGLGTDSMASNNRCDMFEDARFAGLLSRTTSDPRDFVKAETLLALATIGGASALGLDKKTGSLSPGKQADLAIISLDGIGQTPVNDIYSTLVFSTGSDSVLRTMVAGKIVYEHGVITGLDTLELQAAVKKEFGV